MAITMFLMALNGALPSRSGAAVVTVLSTEPYDAGGVGGHSLSYVAVWAEFRGYHYIGRFCEAILHYN